MERLDFYKLSRPVQERLIGSINGTGLPRPILEHRAAPREPLVWLACAGAALMLLLALYDSGMGDLTSDHAIHSLPFGVAYMLLAGGASFSLLRAFALWRARRVLPFRPGVYVFPVGLIDAREHWIRVLPIEDLASTEGPDADQQFRLSFKSGGSFSALVALGDPETARTDLSSSRGRMEEADHARPSLRPKALAALDPLHGVVTPLVATVPIIRTPPLWARVDWAVAIGLGVVLGGTLWALHNASSDDAMFEHAVAANDVASLRAYLARGSRHDDEAAHVLLPRAELKDAVSVGTVDAIEGYIHDHPATGIAQEITDALRAALAGELEKARKAGTLAAIDDFARRHAENRMDAELAAARHAVYTAALARYASDFAPKDPTALAFVERLLASAEKNGPAVSIRFRRILNKSLEHADQAVGKNHYFNGVVSLPSRYFDASHAHAREAAVAATLVEHLQPAFPTELVSFAPGAALDDVENPAPPANVPGTTIVVDHLTDWTGGMATNNSPRGVYVGLGFTFTASFRIPGEKPRAFKTLIYKAPEISVGKAAEKPDETIYETMAKEAFDGFAKRYEATLLR